MRCLRQRLWWRWLPACFLLLVPAAVSANTENACVEDSLKQVICVSQASRIISLAPNLTELLAYVGGKKHLVGVDSSSDFPAAIKGLSEVGDYQRLDIESIVRLQPDLIIAWQSGLSASTLKQLQALDLTVYVAEPATLQEVAKIMRHLGLFIGRSKQADRLANTWLKQFDLLEANQINQVKVRVLFQVWQKPLIVIGGAHLINELINRCGGVNVFNDLHALAPSVSLEVALKTKPELIVTTAQDQKNKSALAHWLVWGQSVPAVKTENLVVLSADELIRSGPRLIEGTKALCQAIQKARA